jgi:hypothetical protein
MMRAQQARSELVQERSMKEKLRREVEELKQKFTESCVSYIDTLHCATYRTGNIINNNNNSQRAKITQNPTSYTRIRPKQGKYDSGT